MTVSMWGVMGQQLQGQVSYDTKCVGGNGTTLTRTGQL